MTLNKITFADKVDSVSSTLPDNQRNLASSWNEIKTVVNTVVDELNTSVSLSYGRISLTASGATDSGPSNTEAQILLDKSDLDSGAVVELVNNGLRVPRTGLYRVTGTIFADDLDNDMASVIIKSNGVIIAETIANSVTTGSFGGGPLVLTQLINLTSGELITLHTKVAAAEGWRYMRGTFLEIQEQPISSVVSGIVGQGTTTNPLSELIFDDTTDGKKYKIKVTNGAILTEEVV